MAKYHFKKTLAGIFAAALAASSVSFAPYTKVLNSIPISASAADNVATISGNAAMMPGFRGSDQAAFGDRLSQIDKDIEYTVSFDTGITGFSLDDVRVREYQTVSEPKNFITPDGYVFIGWFTDAWYDIPFDFTQEIEGDTTIYGRWCTLSGECGENLTWEFDPHTNELTVTGNGKVMDDFYDMIPDFYGLPIESVKFDTPNLEWLGSDFCTGFHITEIEVPDTVKGIGERCFGYCTSLTDVKLPDGLTALKDETFTGCTSLTSIEIPDSVQSICADVFNGCSALKELTIPDTVTSIGAGAFYLCSSLEHLTIPDTVTFFGEWTVNYSGLKTITFESADPSAIANVTYQSLHGYSMLKGCDSLEAIYVPAGCAEYYKNSEGYKTAFDNKLNLIKELPAAMGYSVSYDGNVTINVHYSISDAFRNGSVKFSNGTTVAAEDAEVDTNGYCVFPISVPPKNMYDEITAQFYDEDGNAVGDAAQFDLAKYMDDVKEYDPKYSDFVDCFLEYGAEAAYFFGVTDKPVRNIFDNDDFKTVQKELSAYATAKNMDKSFVGATLILDSVPKLRLYYSKTFTGAKQNKLNPDLYYTEKEISLLKFATVNVNGYSVYNYIYKAMDCDDDNLKALCTALYYMSKALQ